MKIIYNPGDSVVLYNKPFMRVWFYIRFHFTFLFILITALCLAFSYNSFLNESVEVLNDQKKTEIPTLILGDGIKKLTDKEKDDLAYIDRFSRIATVEQAKFGIPASIKIAQGLLESAAGKSKLAKQANNHFGIKCFSKRCAKGHCANFSDDHHKDFFRKYDNAWQSWRAHSLHIANGRYKDLKKYGKNYKKWAHGLKKKGYATDKNYAAKLISIIEKYKLYRYDI